MKDIKKIAERLAKVHNDSCYGRIEPNSQTMEDFESILREELEGESVTKKASYWVARFIYSNLDRFDDWTDKHTEGEIQSILDKHNQPQWVSVEDRLPEKVSDMKDIMTPEEFYKGTLPKWLHSEPHESAYIKWESIYKIMKAYSKYYAKALIESLTDEDISDMFPFIGDREHGSGEGDASFNDLRDSRRGGAKWAREELLKRNEG